MTQRLESLRAELIQQQKPLPGHFRLFERPLQGYQRGSDRIIESELAIITTNSTIFRAQQ